jgi:hypothetical protein
LLPIPIFLFADLRAAAHFGQMWAGPLPFAMQQSSSRLANCALRWLVQRNNKGRIISSLPSGIRDVARPRLTCKNAMSPPIGILHECRRKIGSCEFGSQRCDQSFDPCLTPTRRRRVQHSNLESHGLPMNRGNSDNSEISRILESYPRHEDEGAKSAHASWRSRHFHQVHPRCVSLQPGVAARTNRSRQGCAAIPNNRRTASRLPQPRKCGLPLRRCE